jgi:hypothetical protein
MGRVRIGTCSGLADAALVRSALEAHDIPVVINAEQHASMLGGIGGAFVPLHIYVDGEHAEEAGALLRDLRARGRGESSSEAEADGAGTDDETGDAAGEGRGSAADAPEDGDAEDDDGEPASEVDLRIERRRRAGIVLLLSCFVPLGGLGHLLTGAWLRGLALTGVQVLAFSYLFSGQDRFAVGLFGACKAIDIVGALWRIYRHRPPGMPGTRGGRLPVARMHLR